MERLSNTSSVQSRNVCGSESQRMSVRSCSEPEILRLDGWQLCVYNDNVQAAEYFSANWHTPDFVIANGAGHLLPLARMAWALSSALRGRGETIRIMRPPRGRRSRRLWRMCHPPALSARRSLDRSSCQRSRPAWPRTAAESSPLCAERRNRTSPRRCDVDHLRVPPAASSHNRSRVPRAARNRLT